MQKIMVNTTVIIITKREEKVKKKYEKEVLRRKQGQKSEARRNETLRGCVDIAAFFAVLQK